jgi:hypothetical protein
MQSGIGIINLEIANIVEVASVWIKCLLENQIRLSRVRLGAGQQAILVVCAGPNMADRIKTLIFMIFVYSGYCILWILVNVFKRDVLKGVK